MKENPQSLNTQLVNAVASVAVAQDHLKRMTDIREQAYRDESEARTKVNEAQKNFDDLVKQVKKSAPRDTNWRSVGGVPV